jgi:hypothetical protein
MRTTGPVRAIRMCMARFEKSGDTVALGQARRDDEPSTACAGDSNDVSCKTRRLPCMGEAGGCAALHMGGEGCMSQQTIQLVRSCIQRARRQLNAPVAR